MNAAGGAISVLVGAVLLRLTVTGTYQRYVRVGMGPWLAIAGVVVLALGVATLVRVLRSPGRADGGAGADVADEVHDGHDHPHGVRVGWLLLAPVAALLLVAPPTLGSYGVDRAATVDVRAGASDLPPLEPGGPPVAMSLTEFTQRAFDHDGDSFGGATVQLTGFVADDTAPFRLARYQIACCAVDAAPVVVRVTGTTGDPPGRDRWVTVTGTFRPTGESNGDADPEDDPDEPPTIAATSVAEIPAPDDPYE